MQRLLPEVSYLAQGFKCLDTVGSPACDILLLPGTVAGYVPFRILRAGNHLHLPDLGPASVGAGALAIVVAAVLFRCVWDFFATGKGTLAPIDPPRVLVVRGL